MDKYVSYLSLPMTRLAIEANDEAITGVGFISDVYGDDSQSSELTRHAADQLREYFAGSRKAFDIPLAPHGTPFQQSVWDVMLSIPYGGTMSYGQIAAAIGKPLAVRAVGMASGRNPIAIIIPCHRVVGADGKLVGYGGGIDVKRALLDLERDHSNTIRPNLSGM